MLVSLGRDIQFDAAERHTRLLLQNNRIPGPRLHDFRLTAITIRQRGWIDHLTLLRIPGHETMANLTRFNSYRAPDLQL
ncbi:hypothetical protein [Candidatus Nitrospira neomarina]|uniref:Uncharacterized protein n=1 Tax=Candidatus Nitrospira neomarina TaxID=3020899 RepID=A0AA96JX98_9BACT|nr:hypothetical protein [Candidatus Nitrospira neomarina]WNM63717.1 hypothetical protein PQG83_08175 [Candidatus Nitrospira neomarina]